MPHEEIEGTPAEKVAAQYRQILADKAAVEPDQVKITATVEPFPPRAAGRLSDAGVRFIGDPRPRLEPPVLSFTSSAREAEERVLRCLDLLGKLSPDAIDHRWLALARNDIQKGFLELYRALEQPPRLKLPEDGTPPKYTGL